MEERSFQNGTQKHKLKGRGKRDALAVQNSRLSFSPQGQKMQNVIVGFAK